MDSDDLGRNSIMQVMPGNQISEVHPYLSGGCICLYPRDEANRWWNKTESGLSFVPDQNSHP